MVTTRTESLVCEGSHGQLPASGDPARGSDRWGTLQYHDLKPAWMKKQTKAYLELIEGKDGFRQALLGSTTMDMAMLALPVVT